MKELNPWIKGVYSQGKGVTKISSFENWRLGPLNQKKYIVSGDIWNMKYLHSPFMLWGYVNNNTAPFLHLPPNLTEGSGFYPLPLQSTTLPLIRRQKIWLSTFTGEANNMLQNSGFIHKPWKNSPKLFISIDRGYLSRRIASNIRKKDHSIMFSHKQNTGRHLCI